MSSRRCSVCSIAYPNTMTECPVCEGPLWTDISVNASETWQWEATALIKAREKAAEVDGQPYTLFLTLQSDDDGKLYIDRYDAYRARGNSILQPGDVIELPSASQPGTMRLWEVEYNDRKYGRYYLKPIGELPGPRRAVKMRRSKVGDYDEAMVMYDPAIWEGDGDSV